MAIGSYLIHSGLPWSAPQKIIISSALYINNIVINRGLLNLLNNDYYLDLKTLALNNYILQNLGKHLADTDLHVSWTRINSLFSNIKIAIKDAIYYIPLTWNGKILEYANIQAMIDLIPTNLNSHSIVIYLCQGYDDDNNKPALLEQIDLLYSCILFNGFTGGDVVIYGSNLLIKLTGYTNLDLLLAKLNDTLAKFDRIQKEINDYNILTNKIVIKSNGFNRNYATVAIKNSTANVYLVNVDIQNTVSDWNNLDAEKAKIKIFPAQLNVLNYYSLINNNNYFVNNEIKYLNTDYLYGSSNYALYFSKEDATTIITSSYIAYPFNANETYAEINKNITDTVPDYFSFDMLNELNECPISNELRNYIYNWNKKTKAFTIAFFGHLINDLHNYSNCPIFSDFNLDNGNPDTGLYIYLNKLYRTATNTNDIAEYNTNFEQYYSTLVNDTTGWGLYVLLFVHDKSELTKDVTVPLSTFNNSSSIFNGIEIDEGKMFINLAFYPYNNTNNPCILIPNSATISYTNTLTSADDINLHLKRINYLIPTISSNYFDNNSYPIKLFANKKYESLTPSLKNWDYFTGDIKNLFLFNTILKKDEIKSIVSAAFDTSFNWLSKSLLNIINNINASSYIGALYVYNSHNVNLINNNIKG